MAALPKQLTLRKIRLRVQIKGFRSQTILLVTTLLDPVAYPADQIRQLYLQRWTVELHFREIKTLLALDVLRCRSAAMVEKELLVHVIAYNLVRSVMQQAALRHQVDLERLSSKGTLDTLNRFAAAIQAAHGEPHRQAELREVLFELIARDQLPCCACCGFLLPFRMKTHPDFAKTLPRSGGFIAVCCVNGRKRVT